MNLTLHRIAAGLGPARSSYLIQTRCNGRPTYPDWLDPNGINDPEFVRLEAMGPSQYFVDEVDFWRHPAQEEGEIVGHEMYKYLVKQKMLDTCLGLDDLGGIKRQGLAFYKQHLDGKAIYGWKSAAPNKGGNFFVPYLRMYSLGPTAEDKRTLEKLGYFLGDNPEFATLRLDWVLLKHPLGNNSFTPRFKGM